jgi:hypothetical protein
MESLKSILSLMLVGLLAVACGTKNLSSEDEESSSSGAVAVTVSTAWQTDSSEYTEQASCTATGTAASPATETCTVTIPEARLFYSYLKFDLTHSGSSCEIMRFYPYAYRKSTSAAYIPVGDTAAVDCSAPTADDDPDECWGGPATSIVTDGYYDLYSHLYKTAETPLEVIIDPTNLKTGGDRSLRWVANNLPAADQTVDVAKGAANANAITIDEGYEYDAAAVAYYNYYQDYKATCVDEYGNTTATITVIITDDNGFSPSTDEFDSWL